VQSKSVAGGVHGHGKLMQKQTGFKPVGDRLKGQAMSGMAPDGSQTWTVRSPVIVESTAAPASEVGICRGLAHYFRIVNLQEPRS
jgi:hypothetical protein